MKRLLYLAVLAMAGILVLTPAALAQDVDCPELSYEEAQAILAADPSDPNRLDADNDGEACEQNAASPQPQPSPQPQTKEKEESSEESSKESYTKESTTKQEQRKELPATGGSSFLLPTAVLLLGSGLIVSVVLRRR